MKTTKRKPGRPRKAKPPVQHKKGNVMPITFVIAGIVAIFGAFLIYMLFTHNT